MKSKKTKRPAQLAAGVEWRGDAANPGFLFVVASGGIFGLNRTAAAILTGLAAGEDAEALAARLVETFDIDEPAARRDVAGFLSVLREHDLVTA